jgi:predicted hotdog family 3-hydroxylacyl-ACP dehydratase
VPDHGPAADPSLTALLDRLPHTGAARLPDRVMSLEPGRRVVAARHLRRGDPVLNQDGVLPSALLVELMAQAGGLLLDEPAGESGRSRGGLLAGMRRLHVHGAARGGETVFVTCELMRRLGDVAMLACEATRADGARLAHGRIQLRLLGRGAP